ncbi:MAG: hypothetical protein ACE5GD_06730 [Candidatus Geothermarchaeales archaeon]
MKIAEAIVVGSEPLGGDTIHTILPMFLLDQFVMDIWVIPITSV